MIVAAASWSSTFGPATIAAIGALVIGAFTARWVWKGGTGAALTTLMDANKVLADANTALNARVVRLEEQGTRDQATIAELQARTNVVEVVRPLVETIAAHERKSEERHAATIASQVENTAALRELVGAVRETRV